MVMEKIKENYDFTELDKNRLISLADPMAKRADKFVELFYKKIHTFQSVSKYLGNEQDIARHKEALKAWFIRLFQGPVDDDYLYYLRKAGHTHYKIGLPSYYVNVMINFTRIFCGEIIRQEIPSGLEREDALLALDKMLDINLDILTSSYVQEKKVYFISRQAEHKLIQFAERFSYGLNLILVVGLVILGIIVLVVIGYDISLIFASSMEKGLLATLGSLLMLWVVIELLDTEVDHLNGGKFSINVFVSVAMIAIIRKILVTSLKTEAVEAQYSLIAALAVLAGVYWLVAKSEK